MCFGAGPASSIPVVIHATLLLASQRASGVSEGKLAISEK